MMVLVNLSVVHAGACMDFYGPDEIFIDDQWPKTPLPSPLSLSLSLSLLLLYFSFIFSFIYLFIYNNFLLPYFLPSIL
jgi:hypothetical protein